MIVSCAFYCPSRLSSKWLSWKSPIRLSMLNLMLMEGVGLQISFDKSLY